MLRLDPPVVRTAGTGLYAPAHVLTSDVLAERLGLAPGWIERRTGIAARRIAADHEAVSDLAVAAGAAALDAARAAGIGPDRVSLLVLATSTPDHPLPPTAPTVAHRLGLAAPAFDLAAACTGFIYGLGVAERWLAGRAAAGRSLTEPADAPHAAGVPDRAGGGGRPAARDVEAVLVIGANVLSRRVDWRDPQTAPLFGDGAGALVLATGSPSAGESPAPRGILAVDLHADGSNWDDIYIPAGGSRRPVTQEALERNETTMVMADGSRLFRHAVRAMAAAGRRALDRAGLTPDDVRWFVPHQGGSRIIAASTEALGVPPERVISNVACYGNTSAASIPMALHEAAADGRLAPGDVVLLAAAGAGLTAGAAVLRWG